MSLNAIATIHEYIDQVAGGASRSELRQVCTNIQALIDAYKEGQVSRTKPTMSIAQDQKVACGELYVPEEITITFRGDAARRLLNALARVEGNA